MLIIYTYVPAKKQWRQICGITTWNVDSMTGMTLQFICREDTVEAEAPVHLIGQLESSPLWLYYSRDSDLTVFSVTRLQEAVWFHKHLATFTVPSKLLDESIPFVSRWVDPFFVSKPFASYCEVRKKQFITCIKHKNKL